MKKIITYLKGNLDLLFIFIISVVFSFENFSEICTGYLSYVNYDLQENLLWNFTSIKHLIPYRDIFYPYGLLQYFKLGNIFTSMLYYLIVPALFTIIYFFLKKLIDGRFYRYFSFLLIAVFVMKFTNFATFTRYGIFAILSLFFAYLFWKKRGLSIFFTFLSGMIIGLVISLINDQGLYLLWAFLGLFIVNQIIQGKGKTISNLNHAVEVAKKLAVLALGIFIGMLPVLVYLFLQGGVFDFFQYFHNVSQIVLVAKGPFFNYILYPDNRFTLIVLSVSIFTVIIRLVFYKNKINLFWYFETALILVLVILEQKSIIRSIDSQITFVSFILVLFLIRDFVIWFKLDKKYKNTARIIYLVLPIAVILFWGLRPSSNLSVSFNSLTGNFRNVYSNKCFDAGLKSYLMTNNAYVKIVSLLKGQPDFNGKIYAYPPADSTFYVLLNQNPPYFNAVFEDNSVTSQNQMIKYIKENKIQYITLDLNNNLLQDGVPHYLREPVEFKYILNNYYPFELTGDHLILVKDDLRRDFFTSPLLDKISPYKKYLLNVDLEMIPYSEGMYKYRYFSAQPLIKTDSVYVLNNFLKAKSVQSLNKVFVFIPNKELKKGSQNYLSLATIDGKKTIVYFNACKINKPCIINLSNIPLFYKTRQIESITIDKGFKGSLAIFDGVPKSLW